MTIKPLFTQSASALSRVFLAGVIALILIYWCIALPHRVGIATGLVAGLGVDVLEGAILGQNALAMVVVALLSLLLYQRLRVYSILQQAGVVFFLVGIADSPAPARSGWHRQSAMPGGYPN